ncbi:MAG TPA: signal recognition particle protein [Limnochordia bacterium]
MVFEGLAQKLQETFRRLRSRGKLTESDVDEALREVRLALLSADAHFRVVKDFIQRVRSRAVGQEVLESLTPGQQVIKVVADELTTLLGEPGGLSLAGPGPTVILLVGLQGTGKTTAAAKLARWLRTKGERPLLAACDVYRPAAARQLELNGKAIDVPVWTGSGSDPVAIAREAIDRARIGGHTAVIVDTAGRLAVDEPLMAELIALKEATAPAEVLFVADAMTGQDAVNAARAFDSRIGLTGIILTKLDSDARGGACLSIRAVTGRPIRFISDGERLDAFEPFHPDRLVSRVLGMGDVLSLIERAQASVDETQAQRWAEKLQRAEFDLEDFLEQIAQMRRMGPIEQVLGLIPGLGKQRIQELEVSEAEVRKAEAIIRSMTPAERRQPAILDASRRRRIAAGSGTRVQDVNRLLKQFEQTRLLMKQLGSSPAARRRAGKGKLPPFLRPGR